MNSLTKTPVKRGGERRAGDRRKAELPIAGADRRVADRRDGPDRRG
jgi:hypothetical protein